MSQTKAYKVPEQDIADYYRLGYIVFRRLLPASLIADLRREADKGLLVARAAGGPDVQRLQPIHKHEGKVNLQPFRDYAELPAWREALDQAFGPDYYIGGLKHHLGIFYNPAEMPWCTVWHRDITLQSSRLDEDDFRDLMLNWGAVNQINCPLYEDHCTWFVPGSHLRIRDMPGELAAAQDPVMQQVGNKSSITDPVEKERLCDAYVRSMPGAVQFHLGPGDVAIYRPIGWHLGNYVPYMKRATLHDSLLTERYEKWHRAWLIEKATVPWRKQPEPVAA